MDPFLSGINEQHARQESADSGLGLGSAYSLPHTPEDFLANIDDNMDGTSGKKFLLRCAILIHFTDDKLLVKDTVVLLRMLNCFHHCIATNAFLSFCFADGGAPMETPDLSTLSDNIDSTDDLVPSLQVLITTKSPYLTAFTQFQILIASFSSNSSS